MLNRQIILSFGLLVSVAVANGASAAEDAHTRQPKPCGGYYACIEIQPPQPLPVLRPVKFSPVDLGSTLP